MRMIPLAFCCLLVLTSCQKEIDAGISNKGDDETISFINCQCRLIKMVYENAFDETAFLLDYEGSRVSVTVDVRNKPPFIINSIDDNSITAVSYPIPVWEPTPVSFTYRKGILTSVNSSNKTIAFEYRFDGTLSKIRKFNTGPANGVTLPYRYYKPDLDAQGNIIQLKEFDMAGHQVGKIDITYTKVPNTLSEMTPFNFEMDLGMADHSPLITYFIHKSKNLVSSITINNDPAIQLNYNLDTLPKEIILSKGNDEIHRYFYECQ